MSACVCVSHTMITKTLSTIFDPNLPLNVIKENRYKRLGHLPHVLEMLMNKSDDLLAKVAEPKWFTADPTSFF